MILLYLIAIVSYLKAQVIEAKDGYKAIICLNNHRYDTLWIKTDMAEAELIWNVLAYKDVSLKDSLKLKSSLSFYEIKAKEYFSFSFNFILELALDEYNEVTGNVSARVESLYGTTYLISKKPIGGNIKSAYFYERSKGKRYMGSLIPDNINQYGQILDQKSVSLRYHDLLKHFNTFFITEKSILKKKKRIDQLRAKLEKKQINNLKNKKT